MSVRSGKETNYHPLEIYKGYRIVKVVKKQYHKSIFGDYYDKNWIDHKVTYFDFCEIGEEKHPSQLYEAHSDTIKDCKERIDRFIEDDSTCFTKGERTKYVKSPNEKCDYAYGYERLMKVMREHQKAEKRIKILLADRLVDANFHEEAGFLQEGDYEGFEKFVAKEHPFKRKFEVYTMTQRKDIKDPKSLEDGLNKAISDYLASQGIKDTSVVVRFCEEW